MEGVMWIESLALTLSFTFVESNKAEIKELRCAHKLSKLGAAGKFSTLRGGGRRGGGGGGGQRGHWKLRQLQAPDRDRGIRPQHWRLLLSSSCQCEPWDGTDHNNSGHWTEYHAISRHINHFWGKMHSFVVRICGQGSWSGIMNIKIDNSLHHFRHDCHHHHHHHHNRHHWHHHHHHCHTWQQGTCRSQNQRWMTWCSPGSCWAGRPSSLSPDVDDDDGDDDDDDDELAVLHLGHLIVFFINMFVWPLILSWKFKSIDFTKNMFMETKIYIETVTQKQKLLKRKM